MLPTPSVMFAGEVGDAEDTLAERAAGGVEAGAFPEAFLEPVGVGDQLVGGGEGLDVAVVQHEDAGRVAAVDQLGGRRGDPLQCGGHRILCQQISCHRRHLLREPTPVHRVLPHSSRLGPAFHAIAPMAGEAVQSMGMTRITSTVSQASHR